jgi:hypothetical protein
MYSTCCSQLIGKLCFCHNVKRLEPIWISLNMGSPCVCARCISCSYKWAFFIFMSWSHLGLLNNIHNTLLWIQYISWYLEYSIYTIYKAIMCCIIFSTKFNQHIFSLLEPLNAIMLWNLRYFVIEMIEDMYHDIYLMHIIWIHPLHFEENLIHYVFVLFHSCKINVKILDHLLDQNDNDITILSELWK